MKLILATLLLSFTVSSLAQDTKTVVAEVNGKKITKFALKNYHEQNLKFVRSDKKITVQSSLNDLIDRVIGVENAKKAKLHTRPDLIKKMNDVLYHAYISDKLSPLLKKIAPVTESDIKEYYKANPEYRTSQILLRLRAVPSKEELAETLSKSTKIYNSIKTDSKLFESIASQHSQTTNSLVGGDLGYQPRARLTLEYYDAIKGKKVGTLVQPFRSQYGIHIVKITGVKTVEQIDKKLYQKIIYDQRRDAILAKYFAEQRKAAKIKINKSHLNL